MLQIIFPGVAVKEIRLPRREQYRKTQTWDRVLVSCHCGGSGGTILTTYGYMEAVVEVDPICYHDMLFVENLCNSYYICTLLQIHPDKVHL